MTELSLHILDIAQNSIKANATLIEIVVYEDTVANTLSIAIKDNGCGMSEEFLKNVTSPFRTTRTTRKVGLGLSLFQNAAQLTGGSFTITSEPNRGTELEAIFVHDSIDRQPLGDIASTMVSLISCAPEINFVYQHSFNGASFCFDTRKVREILGDVDITTPDVLAWVMDFIKESTDEIYGIQNTDA